MGVTYAGDIPGGNHMVVAYNQASRASNAADLTIPIFRAPASMVLDSLVWSATGADQGGAHATNHAAVQVNDAGTAGTGTTNLASKGFTATIASNTPTTVSGATTVLDTGDIVTLVFATQATASSTGSMAAGVAILTFKYA